MSIKRFPRSEITPAPIYEPDTKERMIPLYLLLLHNADEPSMQEVAETLHIFTPLSEIESHMVMLEAHRTGVGVIMVEPLESVEYFSEVLRSKGLITTIEPT